MVTSKLMEKYNREKVSKYMTEDVISVQESAPIEDVIKIFMEHGFHGVPVLRGEKVYGMALEKDLLELFFIPEHSLRDRRKMMKINSMLAPGGKVKYFMRRPPIMVTPDSTVGYLISLMLRHDILTVPVVEEDDHTLRGIITLTDLQKLIIKVCLMEEKVCKEKD